MSINLQDFLKLNWGLVIFFVRGLVSSLYSCLFSLVLFGLVLWYINHCRLFNADSFLNIHIKYMVFKHVL